MTGSSSSPVVPILEFEDTGGFRKKDVRRWAEWVVEFRWGGPEDFARRNLSHASAFYFRRPAGTGVLLENGLALTCAHIFSPPRRVKFPDSGSRKAWFRELVTAMQGVFVHHDRTAAPFPEFPVKHVSYWGAAIDAAFVEFEKVDSRSPGPHSGAAPLREFGRPKEKDAICILHHPGGGPLVVSLGEITSVAKDGLSFRHNAKVRGGSSGAPVFGANGALLGIHRGRDDALDADDHVGIPIDVVRQFANEELDPRGAPGLHVGSGHRSVLPRPPQARQEIDIGTFDVFNRDPSNHSHVAYCWVADDGHHEAWAMKQATFVNAGSSPDDHLMFVEYEQDDSPRDWWMDYGGIYTEEPDWEAPATWLANWKAWAAQHLGVQQSLVQYVFHSRFSSPQP